MQHNDDVIVYSTKEPTVTQEQWNTIHEMLSNKTVEEIAYDFTYEYFRKYCYLPGSSFCFNMNFVYFNGTIRPIDKVHSEESFFQQSTVYDFHDLSFDEIMKLKQIYEFIIGEFP